MTGKGTLYSNGLARVLSKRGFCSRAVARQLIVSGRVRLNGRIVRDPDTHVRSDNDRIEVDGQATAREKRIYLMLNKPRGIVTTARDEKGRRTVYSLLPEYRQWVAPVGRLDKASEGLLLLTNDSEWAAKITAPEAHVDKTYHVQVRPVPSQEVLRKLVAGVETKDGDLLTARRALLIRQGNTTSWLEMVLDEGKNRHIRRMLEACSLEVLRLVRVSIGTLPLGDLKKGAVRELTEAEIQGLNVMRVALRGRGV